MGGIVSGVLGYKAAGDAADAQTAAAQSNLQFAEETRDLTRADLAPFLNTGTQAQNALAYEMGLGAAPDGYSGFTATPSYEFQLGEGINALDMSAATRGGLDSGATRKAAIQYGNDLGSMEYGNYLSRLSGLASNGQNAASAQAASNNFFSQQATTATSAIGNAQAAGAIGQANALTGAIDDATGWMAMLSGGF